MASYRSSGIGGWLLVFCLLLLIWQPLSLAIVASSAIVSLPDRGLPLAALMAARLLAAAFGIAAGLALLKRRPGAVAFAKLSLVISAAVDLVVYTTPYFPNNRAPGETPVFILVSLAYSTGWFLYLTRSTRVRETFP